ncbi:hypothetical protein [Streptomyces sp. NPDC055099]
MTRPTLLRRAAAATIGVDQRPSRARVLIRAPGRTLVRRAAAAVIGIRVHRLPTTAQSGTPVQGTKAEAEAKSAGDIASCTLSPLVTLGTPPRPAPGQRPRRGVILATAAAVAAITIGAYVYHEETSVDEQPPTQAWPEGYLGTWQATIHNDLGDNPRRMVIRQGDVGDTVMTLTADGPSDTGGTYHCVFEARLDSVTIGAIRLRESTVASAKPATACKPGEASTLTLTGEDKLHRTNDGTDRGLTYTRSP